MVTPPLPPPPSQKKKKISTKYKRTTVILIHDRCIEEKDGCFCDEISQVAKYYHYLYTRIQLLS